MGQQKAIDYDLLAELGQLERMTAIIGEDTSWSRLFEMTYAPQYRLITMEFLSTFVYKPRGPDYQPQAGPQQSEISFRLCGFTYDLSLAEFGSALGLYTEQEIEMPIYTKAIHTADDVVVSAWTWHEPGVMHFSGFILFVLFIEWETVQPCTVSGGVLQHVLPPAGEGVDIQGVYVTRIARVNGLIDMEPSGMEAFAPVRLDKRKVQGMRIVQKFPGPGLRFSMHKGVIWQPEPNDLHYRDEDPMP
ncbi:hypothetical protein R6Q57_003683 [Mikania cordata]